MDRRRFLQTGMGAALSCAAAKVSVGQVEAAPSAKPSAKPFQLLANFDWYSGFFEFLPNRPAEIDFNEIVDRYAQGGIDALAHNVFEGGFTLIRNSKHADINPRHIGGRGVPFPSCQGYKPLYDAGKDPLKIIIERCHRNGMKYLAAFRMNDRHPHAKGRFIAEHPEWHIRFAGRRKGPYFIAVDFTFPEVRQWMLGLMREAAEQYDVDGLELDYMRWCHMFAPAVARERHPLLTDFMKQARAMLNDVGHAKKKRLLLGARVPQRLAGAEALGFNIPAWIEGGLVDYLCPSDFMYTDFNAPYEEFTRLAQGADCRIYPSIHPYIAQEIDGALLTQAQYRAVAQTFHAAGADGISLYNFQAHWDQRNSLHYPGVASNSADVFRLVKPLRDPVAIASGTRHYLFYPLWKDKPATDLEGVEGVHRMALIERTEIGQRKVFNFRLGERTGLGRRGSLLQFNAVNMTDKDDIAVDLNGAKIDTADIQRLYDSGGLKMKHRRPLGPYSIVRFFLENLPLKQGVNELGVRLVRSDPSAQNRIEIQEVEVIIEPA